ncbi:hypothetical protein FB451DRAFT_1260487 [Mycena latifolia]|nr:hypothetical protein FB451DRAFT_1260487 [Mycena latifolia]
MAMFAQCLVLFLDRWGTRMFPVMLVQVVQSRLPSTIISEKIFDPRFGFFRSAEAGIRNPLKSLPAVVRQLKHSQSWALV